MFMFMALLIELQEEIKYNIIDLYCKPIRDVIFTQNTITSKVMHKKTIYMHEKREVQTSPNQGHLSTIQVKLNIELILVFTFFFTSKGKNCNKNNQLPHVELIWQLRRRWLRDNKNSFTLLQQIIQYCETIWKSLASVYSIVK